MVVETDAALTEGMTVVDYWGVTDREPNAMWVTSVDSDRFFELLFERLSRL